MCLYKNHGLSHVWPNGTPITANSTFPAGASEPRAIERRHALALEDDDQQAYQVLYRKTKAIGCGVDEACNEEVYCLQKDGKIRK